MAQIELLEQHGRDAPAPSARAVAEPSRPDPTTATSTRSTAATIAGRCGPAAVGMRNLAAGAADRPANATG